MNTGYFYIRSPIWSKDAVGLDTSKVRAINKVRIIYKDAEGNRKWPNPFLVSANEVNACEDMWVKGKLLKIVPIASMREIEEHDVQYGFTRTDNQ